MGDFLLGLSDEVGYVVVGWALAADVRDEAFGTHDVGFVEHTVEFLAGGALKGPPCSFLFVPWSFPNDHDLGRDRAFRLADHFKAPSLSAAIP